MTKYLALIIFAVTTLASCKRTYMRICDLPQLVLEPVGFTADEWDTIITRVYDKGFVPPVFADTFIAENADDVLLVSMNTEDAKDFEIIVPSINKTYRLYDIKLIQRTLTVTEGKEEDCYHDMVFVLDSVRHEYTSTGLIRAELRK